MTTEQILSLTEKEPTPLYVFDLGELSRRIAYLKSVLPEKTELCYAVKANTFIIQKAAELVDYLEICSPGEYRICEALSVPHEKYVISGVNKQAGFIEELVAEKSPIAVFTAESKNQFFLLRNAARGRKLPVLLRLTSGTQFGLDEADLFEVIRDYKDDPYIDICGIQYFSGTQKNSLKKLKRELDYVDRIIRDLKEQFSFETRKLEYGTGFPVSYFEGESFDEDTFMKEFSALLSGMEFKGTITLEIGRSIAASCGTYLTKVVDTKINCGERYAIVDGGMNQIVYYGQFMAMKHPKIRLLPAPGKTEDPAEKDSSESSFETDDSSENDAGTSDWNICGSLCTINDFLVKKYPFPDLNPGDILAFESAGAYCPTEGIALFLSRELPGVYLLHETSAPHKVREQIPTERFNSPVPIE